MAAGSRSATPLYPYCCGSGPEHASAYQLTCWPLELTGPASADSPAVQVAVCWLLRLAGQPFAHGEASSGYDMPEMLSLTPPGTVAMDAVGDAAGRGDVGAAEGVAGAVEAGGVVFCAVVVTGGADELRLLTTRA